jgi:uncharacterized protein (DUF1499 family)
MGKKPTSAESTLKPCPKRLNCVSSLSSNRSHFVEPLRYKGSPKTARRTLMKILRELRGASVKQVKGNYIHIECRSRLLRLTDDLELFFDPDEPLVHVRSASRIGFWDLGANRRRIAAVRRAFEKESPAAGSKKKE